MNEQHKQTCREALNRYRIDLIDLTVYDILDDDGKQDVVNKVAAIDAALAALDDPTWEPVEAGTSIPLGHMPDNKPGDAIQTMRGYEYLDDAPRQLLCVSERFGEEEASVYLPDNIRLCRLVEKGEDK